MKGNIRLLLKFVAGKTLTKREITKLMKFAATRKSHTLYEYLLKEYDPFLNVPFSGEYPEKNFLDEGRGMGTIKPCRILENQKHKVFEEVFFNDSNKLSSALHFDKKQDELIRNTDTEAPRIVNVVEGEYLTVLHYEFLNLKKLSAGSAYPALEAKTLDFTRI